MKGRKTQSFIVIAAIIIVILIVAVLHTLINIYLEGLCKNISSSLEDLKKNLYDRDYTESEKMAIRMKKEWDRHANILPLFIDHNDIDFISLTIAQMESYIRSKDAANALAGAESIIKKIESIRIKEKLSLFNIF